MRGMDAATGRELSGRSHLRQSVRDVLTTPIGSRVMLPEYGSRLFELTDRPVNGALVGELTAATAEALDRWEPRYRLRSLSLSASADGHQVLDLDGTYLPDGTPLEIAGVPIQ